MLDEKEEMWFVWERGSNGAIVPAKYRGMPKTGSGIDADNKRFLFKKELDQEEGGMSLALLGIRYPKPT